LTDSSNTEPTQHTNNTIQAFWVGMGSFSSFALAMVSAAILSRYFGKAEYGTYRQVLYVYNTLLIVFSAGLPKVFAYFLPRFNLSEGKYIVWKITKLLVLCGLVFSIFLYFLSDVLADILNNDELSKGLKVFSPIPLLLLPTLGIEGIFSTYKKTIYIAIYNTLTRALMLLCIVLPVIALNGTYIHAIYGWIGSSVIILIMAYFFKGIPFKGISAEKTSLRFKEILTYSLPLVSAAIAGIVYRAANQFYISRFFGPEVFAEFSNGFIEIPFVHMITGATATVLMPVFSKAIFKKEDMSQVTKLWRSTLQKSAILIYPMVIYFLFYAEELITLVYSDAYTISARYFSIAMVVNFFNIIIFAPLLLALGEANFYARLHYGLAIVTWIVEYLVVVIFNTPEAVAISFVVIVIGGVFVSLVFSARKLGVSFISLFPAGRFAVIACHAFLGLFVVNFILRRLLHNLSDFWFISIAAALYAMVLFITSKIFHINYIEILRPLLARRKT